MGNNKEALTLSLGHVPVKSSRNVTDKPPTEERTNVESLERAFESARRTKRTKDPKGGERKESIRRRTLISKHPVYASMQRHPVHIYMRGENKF